MDAHASELEFAQKLRWTERTPIMADAVPDIIRTLVTTSCSAMRPTSGRKTVAAELLHVPSQRASLVLASGLLIQPGAGRSLPRRSTHRARAGAGPRTDPSELGAGAVRCGAVLQEPRCAVGSSADALQVGRHLQTWLAPNPPAIYVTLGTIFNTTSGDLFERLLAGLADCDADVVATVGRGIDPADLGHQPANVRVERFLPQDEVLPLVDLVVSHGGSGSLMASLANGLPSVLLPLGADQPHNATRAEELGVAFSLDA